MKILSKLVKCWAYISISIVLISVAFLFGYIFYRGGSTISLEFLTQAPGGAVLGTEGGIFPAITGSLAFTFVAVLLGSVPAVATAIYLVFYCDTRKKERTIRMVVECISGIPSIVLGLFAYSVLVRSLNLGRCVLASGTALAIMILPFIEVRTEKALRELPQSIIAASDSLGCSKAYAIRKIVLPACKGEVFSGIILGACYAMGATAPLMFTGGVAFAKTPTSVMQPAMALPLHLYLLVAQGTTSLDLAYGTAFVMMMIILIGNTAVTLYSRRKEELWQSLR
ncbi:MAG: ABC transporter permease subunit [Mogibacterium sp.]|nr:ABC transporter permease subunit [Mogibacterium sp.]